MNPDLNKANQEHKDLDNRSYIIGFEEGYNNAIEEVGKMVKMKRFEPGNSDWIKGYNQAVEENNDILEAINKLKK